MNCEMVWQGELRGGSADPSGGVWDLRGTQKLGGVSLKGGRFHIPDKILSRGVIGATLPPNPD